MTRDDLEEYIREQLEEGIEITAEDFEGRPCSYCGDLIEFTTVLDDPDAQVTWDIKEQEPGEEPTGYYHRYHFCSEDCRNQAMGDTAWIRGETEYGESDVIPEHLLEGQR